MLKFDNEWRFNSPREINDEVVREFDDLINKIARGQQNIIESFKSYFAGNDGNIYSKSSDLGWAYTDLWRHMKEAAKNAPLFIEAFYDACEALKNIDFPVPDLLIINQILARHETGYRIEPPHLIYSGVSAHEIKVPVEVYTSLDQKAQEIIQKSLHDARIHWNQGNYKSAVQESLWLLETVSTIFKGVQINDETKIVGKYFSKIIFELKKKSINPLSKEVSLWIESLYNFLSGVDSGGIRHGMNLKEGIMITSVNAKLYCDLINSYISYLLSEYEQLNRSNNTHPLSEIRYI